MRKRQPPSRTLAIVGRVTSCLGFLGALWLAKYSLDARQPLVCVGVVLLGVAYANKFSGAELAAICHEVAEAFGAKKVGQRDNPSLPMNEEGTND